MSTYPFILEVGELALNVTFEISDIQVPPDLFEELDISKWIDFFKKKSKEFPTYTDKFKLLFNAKYALQSINKKNGKIESITFKKTFSCKRRICFTIVFTDDTSKKDYLWLMSQKFGNVLLN